VKGAQKCAFLTFLPDFKQRCARCKLWPICTCYYRYLSQTLHDVMSGHSKNYLRLSQVGTQTFIPVPKGHCGRNKTPAFLVDTGLLYDKTHVISAMNGHDIINSLYVVCVCTYMCVCVYVCICMYVCMYVFLHVCVYYVCMYVCVYVCMYVCMYVYVCIYVCVYICMWYIYKCVCVCACVSQDISLAFINYLRIFDVSRKTRFGRIEKFKPSLQPAFLPPLSNYDKFL
jgi:nuclear pore complex protein Nup62